MWWRTFSTPTRLAHLYYSFTPFSRTFNQLIKLIPLPTAIHGSWGFPRKGLEKTLLFKSGPVQLWYIIVAVTNTPGALRWPKACLGLVCLAIEKIRIIEIHEFNAYNLFLQISHGLSWRKEGQPSLKTAQQNLKASWKVIRNCEIESGDAEPQW